ncbi:hypothetical protein C2G38_2097863, partial [Gigaspora rosea]
LLIIIKFDIDLAVMICNGLRPKFAPSTPDCYVELANQCMNTDPDKRPNFNEIITKLNAWLKIIRNKKIKIKLYMITEKLNDIYTSKPYNISEISTKFSKTAGFIEVPNDI